MKVLDIGGWAIAQSISEWIEIAAIAVIAFAVVVALVEAVRAGLGRPGEGPHTVFRSTMARGLLVGLDLLIAADVIRTVTLEPTLENVSVLGLVVVVRTFLSWSLVLETENRWPWQREPADAPSR